MPGLKSALYTGFTCIGTVLLLVLPYLLFQGVYAALGVTLLNAVIVILVFNLYIAVAKGVPFWARFSETAILSMGIASASFGIGFLARKLLGTEA